MFQVHDAAIKAALHGAPDKLIQPPQQQRSRDRQRALLSAGLKLTENRDWEEVTIAEIAAQSGFSVGSFYTRFPDKQAYLDVLISLVAEQVQRHMDTFIQELRTHDQGYLNTLTRFVEQAIQTHIKLRGIFRMSILLRRKSKATHLATHTATNTLHPHPFTQMRLYSCGQFVELMLRYMDKDDEASRVSLSFAHQMMNSTLVNAILTDPGPFHVEDAEFKAEMINAINAYLSGHLHRSHKLTMKAAMKGLQA